MSDNQEVAVPAVPEEKPVLSGDPVEKNSRTNTR